MRRQDVYVEVPAGYTKVLIRHGFQTLFPKSKRTKCAVLVVDTGTTDATAIVV